MNYLKTLVLIVMMAASNVSASTSTGLEEQMNGMTIAPGWVSRAKAILPQIQNAEALQISVELKKC